MPRLTPCYDQRKDSKTKQTQQLLMADKQDPTRPEARLHNNLSHVQKLKYANLFNITTTTPPLEIIQVYIEMAQKDMEMYCT